MHDEGISLVSPKIDDLTHYFIAACVHFEDMVDQMTLGHQFLFDTFGIVPKIGWQLGKLFFL